MSLDLDKSGSYIRGISSGAAMPSVKELFNIISYFNMSPYDFFAPLGNDNTPYNILCERLRLLDNIELDKNKIAVDEETVRLRSHITQLVDMIDSDETLGKKFDFVVQEMNREANTIGSKSQNVEITRIVVDIKGEIEKIREQVQNLE